MEQNNQNPKTKVNPLDAGLGLEGLKGYDPQNKTQEIKKESQVYTVTRNDGSQVDKAYSELTPGEKKAVATTGIVEGGKTDIEKQYSVVSSKVGVRPAEPVSTGSGLGTIGGLLASISLGAKTGGFAGAAIAGGTYIGSIGAAQAEANQKYHDALKEFNDRVSENTVIAGDWEKDEDGNMIFMPDYSKVGKDINVSESGAKVANLFNLNDNTEPNVFFTNDGVLHVDVNRAFADTEEYKGIVDSISSDYAGLTKDTADVDTYLRDIKQRIGSALDQYRFEVNRVAGYRSKLPNASVETIMDAARGEIGAMLADSDKKDWTVKVYRDGKIVESNAQEVLDNVYNMGDKYKRNDYIEGLAEILNDDSVSDDNKAYVLAEYNLLFSASDADVKEGKKGEERKKYAEMLDQDFLVTFLRSSKIVSGFDKLIDGVAGFISQGQVDDILIANQDYLEPEEVASNLGALVGTAFDVYVTQKTMQGIEQKFVRPVLGAGTRGIGRALVSSGSETLSEAGKKMIEASWKAVTNRAGEVIGYRTALGIDGVKNAALNNVIQSFGSGDSGLSYRLLAKGAGELMAWSVGELSINFASDALFDATKLGTAILSGEVKTGEEAQKYMADALGQDLMMDLVLQYGPQGMLDIQTTGDAIRLQKIEPYAQSVAKARADYGEALGAIEEAKTVKTTAKRMKELESDALAKKNALTKAQVDYESAKGQWVGGRSQKFGAKIAEIESRMSENAMYRKFQEVMVDENAAGTALVRAAYYASGGDVELFNKLMNTASNNLRTLTRITANEMASDKWAKGTGEALNAFKQKYSDLSSYTGKMSQADVDYMKARNEVIRYTEAAKGDKDQIAKTEANYAKYINAVAPERAAQLDELMDTMRNVINKTNESAVNAGIDTEENIQTKRSATGFQEQGYIPMYLKRKHKTGRYVISQERNLDRTWDRGEFWDIDNLENPVLNTLTYVNYTARNIAVNERNKAIIAATEIPGMRTYRTDEDNAIIRTADGNAYKHSDIIGHMEPKIDKRIDKLSKLKKETPTELEFSDEKDKILYGKTDGTHEELVDEFETEFERAREEALGKTAGEIERLKAEEEQLRKDFEQKSKEQDEALSHAGDPEYYERFERGKFPDDALRDTTVPAEVSLDNAIEWTIFGTDPDMPRQYQRYTSPESEYAMKLEWVASEMMKTPRGKAVFSDVIEKTGGDTNAAAKKIADDFFKFLVDTGNFDSNITSDYNASLNYVGGLVRKFLTRDQLKEFRRWQQVRANDRLKAQKRKVIGWWNATKSLRERLGVEGYTYGYTDINEVNGGRAYGNYNFAGEDRRLGRDEEGLYTINEPIIRISLNMFESLPEMKSTIVHEAAHSAFSRAANRVPLLTDALRILGVDAKVSREMAVSEAASELIAHMTQKKYLSEFLDKKPSEVMERLRSDSVVQGHLNALMEMMDKPPVNFKERFLDQIRNIITFVKAKLAGNTSLRDVKTLEDFYTGLISGRFASDMRINTIGTRLEHYGGNRGDLAIDWSKVPADAEELALDLIKIQEKIDANIEKQQGLANRVEASEIAAKDALRAEVNRRVDELKKYYDDTYSKFGYTTGVRVSQAKIDGFIETGDMEGLATYLENLKDRTSLARPTDQELTDVEFNKQVTGLEIEVKRSMNKNFPGLDGEQKKDVLARILGEFRRKAIESGDVTAQQVAEETYARNVGYPITYFEEGVEKTAYIDGPLAKPVYEMCVRSENVVDKNFLQKTFEGAAKLKRYATTAIDVTRALPNLLRDALRGDIMSGGTDYAGARKLFTEILEAEDLTVEQKNKAIESIELAMRVAQGETLNAAVENRTERGLQDMVRETRQEGKNTVSRIIWDVAHGRIGHALETPMNVAEMYTRRRMAQSAFVREFKNARYTSSSFDERLNKAYDAGLNAGMENTTNFSRRGAAVGAIARYVPYFQQNFANLESANNAFLKDPAGVSARAAIFSYAYVMMLADTLKKEETRRAYYNLSDYDRKNNVVFSLDGETLVTIPLDESLASLITPWRRTLETLNGIDPGTFASIFTDTLLDLSPLDLDGFTEGDGLNVKRGIEKLTSQVAPSLATELAQTITGYNLYYGSSGAVTDETLAGTGQIAESAGDYTTPSANSKILRAVADATGIPQWQLQQVVANFGGNVGQYVLNTLDKLAGASKDEQGGKEFVNAVFKSMTGTDSQNVKNQFYNGMETLKKERAKVVNKLEGIREEIATATGTELADLKKKYQEVKDAYGKKVSDFLDQYLSAYEITGGLEEKQASQVFYLFNLYDDDTVYEPGSVGEYYQNLARQQAYNEADSWAAPVLDKYYDQTRNVYKDSSGVWHYSSPYGEQAYYNTIYGKGMKYQVGLRNLIEGVTNNLKSARTEAYNARSEAMARKDYDAYDQIGADFDAQVVKAITPYINEYGAENVLNNSSVLDYLEEWFFVPSSYMKTKKNRYIPSLAHNASKQRAFVRSYIKSLYNVDTGYTENNYESLLNPEVF